MRAILPLPVLFILASAASGLAVAADPVASAIPALSAAVDLGSVEDPNADRGFLLPTALTQPARTLTVSDYDIVVAGATYGITDRLQVGVTATPAGGLFLPERMAIGSLKWQFLRAGNLRLAVLGGAIYSENENHDGRPARRSRSTAGQAALAASYCLTDDCHSLLTTNLLTTLAIRLGHQDPSILYSAGGTFRLSRRWKLLIEAQQAYTLADDAGGPTRPVISAGFRLFGRHLAGEAGFMTFFGSHGSPFPLPYLSATFRL